MNQDAFINTIAHGFGIPRTRVIEVLKQMSRMPEVQMELKKKK